MLKDMTVENGGGGGVSEELPKPSFHAENILLSKTWRSPWNVVISQGAKH